MEKRRILVTAISGDLGNGILKCLVDSNDILFGCDVYDYPAGIDKVYGFQKVSFADKNEYVNEILQLCKNWRLTHIIPGNEHEILRLSEHIELFEENNVKVLIQEKRLLDIFLNKYETAEFLSGIDGISVPQTFLLSEYEGGLKKIIVKPVFSNGSKQLWIGENIDEFLLPEGYKKSEFIVQEYIEGIEYTTGVFSDGSNTKTIVFKRELKNGYTSFVELENDESIHKDSVRIAQEIGLKGYINIQLRQVGGLNYIFEINPRISGSVVFRHLVGFDDVRWWLDLADNSVDSFGSYSPLYRRVIGVRELAEKLIVAE